MEADSQLHALTDLLQGKTLVPFGWEVGRAQGSVWTLWLRDKFLSLLGIEIWLSSFITILTEPSINIESYTVQSFEILKYTTISESSLIYCSTQATLTTSFLAHNGWSEAREIYIILFNSYRKIQLGGYV
jgi:hypothetical protein